ncbi:MAG: PAS domain-containing protein [Desulfomonile tiedjei]|uniref:histidine kinase n=1 Tax=Desulfomonile tiedjei TaxID=2358 RepID=A0A9D6V6T7_9BACT|nr:PAS domain-containing protein [Desulfomonile tiedjei]
MPKRPTLLWKLYPSYLVVALLSFCLMAWHVSSQLADYCNDRAVNDLKTQALLVEKLVGERFFKDSSSQIDTMLKEMGSKISSRITVALASGAVLGDSQMNAARMDSLKGRPEIKEAMEGRVGISTRMSLTMDARMIFVAVPVKRGDAVTGIVRAALPSASSDALLWTNDPLFWVILFFLPGICCFYWSRRLSCAIGEFRAAARKFSEIDLGYRVDERGTSEFSELTDAMNTMAAELNFRLSTVTRQRNELEAVLSGMMEAVMVVDTDERIVRINRAAEQLFRIQQDRVKGKTIQEAIRHTDLHRFVTGALVCADPLEGDIVIIGDPDIFLQARGATLRDDQGRVTSALIVLNDVTRLKTLEMIRRDFVANVSHELKTPITSIKGFLETLKEGAIKDPENAERFLDISIRHTDRLNAIIEDLLSLSRIERDAERGEVALESRPVNEVLDAVAKACGEKARGKTINLEFRVKDGIVADINPTLLEQALVNLVDNAVKYSEPGKTVVVTAEDHPGEVVIKVKDQGCGISKDHITRIFERFYRVDKARSRKVGGTGLGLAIVKHIVHAHGGRILVESSPAKGSVFSIHLPSGQKTDAT